MLNITKTRSNPLPPAMCFRSNHPSNPEIYSNNPLQNKSHQFYTPAVHQPGAPLFFSSTNQFYPPALNQPGSQPSHSSTTYPQNPYHFYSPPTNPPKTKQYFSSKFQQYSDYKFHPPKMRFPFPSCVQGENNIDLELKNLVWQLLNESVG